MARVHMDGFEFSSAEYLTIGAAVAITMLTASSTRNNQGICASIARTLGNATASEWMDYTFPSAAQINEGYIRFAFFLSGDFNSTDSLNSHFRVIDSSGNAFIEFIAESGPVWKLYAGTGGSKTLLASGLTANTWHLLQAYFKLNATTGEVTVKLDGVAYTTVTGAVGANSATLTKCRGQYRHTTGSVLGSTRFDDIAVNNTTGTDHASYPPDGNIRGTTLSASGASSNWLGSDGNSTNNYQLVDERPFSASDYVEADGVSDLDLYEMTDVTLPSGSSINAVQLHASVRKTTNDNAVGVTFKARQSSTNYSIGSEYQPPDTVSHTIHSSIMEKAPDTSTWTESILNGLQIGMERTT